MNEPAKRRATYADVLAAPEHLVAEIVGGELHVNPRPASPHAFASSDLGALLSGPFRFGNGGPGGWWLLDEPELHLGADPDVDVVVPDVAGWRRERMPARPNVAYFTLAPDWVCEVLSPRTQRIDRIRKMPLYAREGVAHAWLLDPLEHTLEVFRLEQGRWALLLTAEGSAKVRAEPFDAIELELGLLWCTEAPTGE